MKNWNWVGLHWEHESTLSQGQHVIMRNQYTCTEPLDSRRIWTVLLDSDQSLCKITQWNCQIQHWLHLLYRVWKFPFFSWPISQQRWHFVMTVPWMRYPAVVVALWNDFHFNCLFAQFHFELLFSLILSVTTLLTRRMMSRKPLSGFMAILLSI